MVSLTNKDSGAVIGDITEEQLQFLIDQLEEESVEDQTYWLNRTMLDVFRERGADPDLLSLLETAMGNRDDIEIEWHK